MDTIIPCLRTNNRRMCGEGGIGYEMEIFLTTFPTLRI